MSTIYGTVEMPYRNPSTINMTQLRDSDSNQRRSILPNRLGIGTKATRALPTPVVVENGRLLHSIKQEQFHLDTHAFDFVKIGTSLMQDWGNNDEIVDIYFPEIEAIIRQNVDGADHPECKVLIFDHALRSGGVLKKEMQKESDTWQNYAGLVHTDATVRSVHTRAKDQILGTNETKVKYGRYPKCWGDVRPTTEWQNQLFRAETKDHQFPDGTGGEHMIVNVWRPLYDKVPNWGLAVMDGSSLAQGDVHPTILNSFDNNPGGRTKGDLSVVNEESKVFDTNGELVPIRYGEVLTPIYSPKHRWVYFPDMEPEEALLLKIFDSRRNVVRNGCHSAFRDPMATNPKGHRRSIEVRCLIIFPPNGKGTGAKM